MREKTKQLKNQVKGITLVALVVTIIILLILAGTAINLTLGEDGIFKKAGEGAQIYQNASKNEKIEIDKVSNYIDDYLNANKNEDNEEEKLSEVEEAIKNGTVYKTNTTIYDEYKNPIKVPTGFKIAEDSGTDVTKGVVIEDVHAGDEISKGNQYVWVPIGNVKYNISGEYKTINLGRYSFDARYNEDTQQIEGTGKETLMQSADNYTSTISIETDYQELQSSSYGNTIAKNLGDFITKAKNAGGYYIGRYEAGKVEGNTETFNVKKGQEVYNIITQPNAATLARELYSSNSNFNSDLINSYAWDTAIAFIQTFSGDSDYSKQNPLQTSLTTTGNAHDSSNNYDVRCNIYDMGGNICEWTTESCMDIDNPCTVRGGYYGGCYGYSGVRDFRFIDADYDVGIRPIMYL